MVRCAESEQLAPVSEAQTSPRKLPPPVIVSGNRIDWLSRQSWRFTPSGLSETLRFSTQFGLQLCVGSVRWSDGAVPAVTAVLSAIVGPVAVVCACATGAASRQAVSPAKVRSSERSDMDG